MPPWECATWENAYLGKCRLGKMPPWENATWEVAVVECAGGKVPGAKCPRTLSEISVPDCHQLVVRQVFQMVTSMSFYIMPIVLSHI